MPRAIAIETSGRIGSVAVVQEGHVLAEDSFPHGLQHAATILPMIDRLVRGQNWRPRDIDHVYVSAGPGSFTGLRIGITLAKTLALSIGAKIVAVPSARVLLGNVPADAREVVIVLDAKRGQIFTARYTRPAESTATHSGWTEVEPEHLDTLAAMLARAGRPVHLIGEGVPYHQASVPNEAGVIVTDESTSRARAAVVAEIGTDMARAGAFSDAHALTPTYVRLPEAEEKRLIAEGKLGPNGVAIV